jgi:pimeloyl-ACP methyl ester carboxylesterase
VPTLDLHGPVHYVDHGGEGPPVVLVHGLGGSHANWCAVAPALARSHRVLAIDLPGFGRTPLAGRTTKLEDQTDVLARFVERLAGRATLVGNSMGGLLSLMTAARHPERVDSLVLVNAAHPPVRGMRLDREVALVFAMYMLPFVGELIMERRMRRISAQRLVRETMQVCCAEPDKLSREIIDAHVAIAEERRAMQWSPEAFLVATRSLVRALATPWKLVRMADSVRAPTLVIHGDRDRLVPVAAARAAAERRHWQLEILPGIGHVPQLEAPDKFVALVEGFLRRAAGATAAKTASNAYTR